MKPLPFITLLMFLAAMPDVGAAPKGFPVKVQAQPRAVAETNEVVTVTAEPEMKPVADDAKDEEVAEAVSEDDGEKRRWFRLGKKDEEAAAAEAAKGPVYHFPKSLEGIDFSITPTGEIPSDPWKQLWGSADFQRSFMGRYGFHPNVEPELTDTNDLSFMREFAPLMTEDPKVAAYVLKTNLTAKSHPQFDFTLGSLYFQLGDMESAARHYQTAIDKFPDFRRAQKNLGFSFLKLSKFEEAAGPLAKAVELGDRDSTTFGLLGFCHMNAGRYIPSEAAYRQAILFQPDNKDWRLGLVKALVAQEKLNEANRLVDEVLGKDPTAHDMWLLQAGIFARMEKNALAAVNYEIVRKLGKADAATLFSLGDIYMAQDSKDLALPVYLDAIDEAGAADVKRGLRAAKILVSRGAQTEAKKLFAQVRKSAGDKLKGDDELELLKLESKVAVSEGDAATAVKILAQVVERNPLDGEALIMIGDHYLKNADARDDKGRIDHLAKAEHRFDLASKIAGFEPDAFVKLAQVRVKQEKFDDAIALLNKAQKIQPRDSVQRYLEAIERLRRAAGA